MKRILRYTIILTICVLLLSACGKKQNIYDYSFNSDAPSLDFSSVVTVVSTPAAALPSPTILPVSATPVPVSTPEPTPAPTPVPVSTPIPTPAPAVNYVTITKSPLSETVAPGGTAVFTSYADYSTSVNWIVASSDRKTIYTLADAPNHFPGLQVSGINTNVVTLSNIPVMMNGWEIQCYFTGNGGPKYSADAYIYVNAVPTFPGGFTPQSIPEAVILQNAQKCVQAVKSYSNLGYIIGDMENYNYTFDPATGGSANFNVTFSNINYSIVAEFIATADSYYPVSAAVFDSSWAVKQAYSFINDANLYDFYSKVLVRYK